MRRTTFQNTYGPQPILRMWRVVYRLKDGRLLGGEVFLQRDRTMLDALFTAAEKFGVSLNSIVIVREVDDDERGHMRDVATEGLWTLKKRAARQRNQEA